MSKPSERRTGAERSVAEPEAHDDACAVAREAEDDVFRLDVGQLLPGRSGEVVLYNDSAMRELVLEANQAPVEQGQAGRFVTGDGVDVTGFRFLRFADGLVIFHDPDTRVRLDTRRAPV